MFILCNSFVFKEKYFIHRLFPFSMFFFIFEKFLSSSIPVDHLTKHDNWEGLRKASPKHILVGIQMMLYCCCWPTNGEQCRLKTVNRETKKPNKKNRREEKRQKQITHSHAVEDAPLRLDMNCLTFRALDVDYEKQDLNILEIPSRRTLFAVTLRLFIAIWLESQS